MKKSNLKLLLKSIAPNPALWNKIQQINMQLIKDRMMIKHGWSEERTDDAIQLYLIYIYITQVYNQPVSPSEDVDEIWHTHILHTNKYEIDCHLALGKFLHHFPTPSAWSKDIPVKNKASFCCDSANCCNDDPRSTLINKRGLDKKSNCSGTTNCGNEPPSDCASFKPGHCKASAGRGLAVDSNSTLTENSGIEDECSLMAQSLHGRLGDLDYDALRDNLGKISFFKDLIPDFFEYK